MGSGSRVLLSSPLGNNDVSQDASRQRVLTLLVMRVLPVLDFASQVSLTVPSEFTAVMVAP